MKSKKVQILGALTALGLACAGVHAAAQESGRQRGTTGVQPEQGMQGGAQASPTAGQGIERAVPAVQQPSGPARIDVRQVAPFGAVLVDERGHSLYAFSSDSPGRSACEGECLRDWLPLLTQGSPIAAGRAIQSTMLGTMRRADGSMQVTYNQMPLYTFRMDRRPGEVRGQRMRAHGGDWYLVGPNGQRIERQPAATATPATGGERGTGTPRSEMPRSPGSPGSSGERPMPR